MRPLDSLAAWPIFQPVLERLGHLHTGDSSDTLRPERVEQLYGPVLETSVSRLEQFAACPFRFFVNSGLQAEERKKFEFEIREQGQFQHAVLAEFHQQLRQAGQRWRDLSPNEARDRIGRIADELLPVFQNGLMLANEQNRFLARSYKESLLRFVATVVAWMAQYEFDPVEVELGFGVKDGKLPAWELDLGDGHRLAFRGRIDRVDLWRAPGADEALCVVMDYKSSARKLDALLLEHGIQQQLPAYLNVLRRANHPEPVFGVSRVIPAGVFFVNLRGQYAGGSNRNQVLVAQADAQKQAYLHEGRFDLAALRKLDKRDTLNGDQFSYRLRQSDAQPVKGSQAPMPSDQFTAFLDRSEELLREMGRRIFAGDAKVAPYRKGQDTPCDKCDYQSICRIDPWTHHYRGLKPDAETGKEKEA